ncbi:outer membrane beta-barrel protein [Flavobacterium dankookense]|uniref:Outer membrane protein with beta-barrel domain n=1 Tax=Flavobacterium dankookense TaxID=706186 RepID=A0A4R6QEQ5_9FLAO|nr:outer membrane beta-barrel protein [Flavobacterium dankookense]TDP60727.1 outer membrane protein with beta-barrel domain [Flavobacterium dankookense]
MKKLLFAAIAVFTFGFTNAQETKFGAKAGVDLATAKVKILGTTATASETGFFLGGFANIGLSEKFSVQPELLYVAITDLNFISVPVLAKYNVAEKFGIIAGPSLNYFLDAEEDEFKVNVDFGAIYDITEEIDVNAKYSLGMGDVSVSGIFIGAGYKF